MTGGADMILSVFDGRGDSAIVDITIYVIGLLWHLLAGGL